MNKDNKNKELIEQITEALRNHAEPYKEGAWERFASQSRPRRKRSMAWMGWGAAAVVLFATGLFLFTRQEQHTDVVHQGTELAQEPTVENQEKPTTVQIGDEGDIRVTQPEARQHALAVAESERYTQPEQHADAFVATIDSPIAAHMAAVDTAKLEATAGITDRLDEQAIGKPEESAQEEHQPADVRQPISSEELLAAESTWPTEDGIGRAMRNEETNKWNIGVVVAPSMTSERLNIGGGFAVAYQLSDKFSLASGVSLSDLNVAQQQPGSPQRQMSSSLEPNAPVPGEKADNTPYRYREITSITSTLLAVDIPVNLRYHVTKGLYTSVGVSFLGILNERRTNHFVDHINQPTASPQLTAVHSTERSRDQPLEGKGYAGFINFSIGRNVPLSSKLSISFEPYFKLPVGRLSREDMDLTNGGIRIVTGF